MTDKPEDPELIAILPIEASMSGRNSTYVHCGMRQQMASYAVCLHALKKIDDHTIAKEQFVECQRAYLQDCNGDLCPSKKMREDERAAGQALYFKPRPRHITDPSKEVEKASGAVSSGKYDLNNPSYARGWAIGGREGHRADVSVERRSKPVRSAAPVKKSGFIQETSADLVNALMKESSTESKAEGPKPEAVSSTRPLPGESIADFIKRRAAEKHKK